MISKNSAARIGLDVYRCIAEFKT